MPPFSCPLCSAICERRENKKEVRSPSASSHESSSDSSDERLLRERKPCTASRRRPILSLTGPVNLSSYTSYADPQAYETYMTTIEQIDDVLAALEAAQSNFEASHDGAAASELVNENIISMLRTKVHVLTKQVEFYRGANIDLKTIATHLTNKNGRLRGKELVRMQRENVERRAAEAAKEWHTDSSNEGLPSEDGGYNIDLSVESQPRDDTCVRSAAFGTRSAVFGALRIPGPVTPQVDIKKGCNGSPSEMRQEESELLTESVARLLRDIASKNGSKLTPESCASSLDGHTKQNSEKNATSEEEYVSGENESTNPAMHGEVCTRGLALAHPGIKKMCDQSPSTMYRNSPGIQFGSEVASSLDVLESKPTNCKVFSNGIIEPGYHSHSTEKGPPRGDEMYTSGQSGPQNYTVQGRQSDDDDRLSDANKSTKSTMKGNDNTEEKVGHLFAPAQMMDLKLPSMVYPQEQPRRTSTLFRSIPNIPAVKTAASAPQADVSQGFTANAAPVLDSIDGELSEREQMPKKRRRLDPNNKISKNASSAQQPLTSDESTF